MFYNEEEALKRLDWSSFIMVITGREEGRRSLG